MRDPDPTPASHPLLLRFGPPQVALTDRQVVTRAARLQEQAEALRSELYTLGRRKQAARGELRALTAEFIARFVRPCPVGPAPRPLSVLTTMDLVEETERWCAQFNCAAARLRRAEAKSMTVTARLAVYTGELARRFLPQGGSRTLRLAGGKQLTVAITDGEARSWLEWIRQD